MSVWLPGRSPPPGWSRVRRGNDRLRRRRSTMGAGRRLERREHPSSDDRQQQRPTVREDFVMVLSCKFRMPRSAGTPVVPAKADLLPFSTRRLGGCDVQAQTPGAAARKVSSGPPTSAAPSPTLPAPRPSAHVRRRARLASKRRRRCKHAPFDITPGDPDVDADLTDRPRIVLSWPPSPGSKVHASSLLEPMMKPTPPSMTHSESPRRVSRAGGRREQAEPTRSLESSWTLHPGTELIIRHPPGEHGAKRSLKSRTVQHVLADPVGRASC
jgi:hypothetical protein